MAAYRPIADTTARIFADPQAVNAADDGWKDTLWRALADTGGPDLCAWASHHASAPAAHRRDHREVGWRAHHAGAAGRAMFGPVPSNLMLP